MNLKFLFFVSLTIAVILFGLFYMAFIRGELPNLSGWSYTITLRDGFVVNCQSIQMYMDWVKCYDNGDQFIYPAHSIKQIERNHDAP